MPPLPADSIHARACKLKCEKILTRPPMEVRVSQQVLIVTNILQQYGMEFKLRPESGG